MPAATTHPLRGMLCGLLAAILFGASVPACKAWAKDCDPLMSAALLYAGSGFGLVLVFLLRGLFSRSWGTGIARRDWPLLTLSMAVGGWVAPVALMWGLLHTSGSAGSLLGNVELVFTALLAWAFFREKISGWAAAGLGLVAIGGVALALGGASDDNAPAQSTTLGLLAVTLAYLAWSLDNNLTRKLSANDPLVLAGLRGLAAGAANLLLAMGLRHQPLPETAILLKLLATGALGYGGSLALLVLTMRSLGAARAGAVFGLAPFFGTALSVAVLKEAFSPLMGVAAGCMALGVAALGWEGLRGERKNAE